jgi:ketosteroid isomerase-like protein
MKLVRSGAAALLAVLFCAGPGSAAQPPAVLMANIQTFVAITQGKSTVDIDSLFTPDAIVIDENAPFRWDGPHAASQWLASLHGLLASMHTTSFTVTSGTPTQYTQSTDAAYAIVPLTISGTAGAQHIEETGTLTFTFRLIDGDWKIATDVWTTVTKRG